MSQAGPLDFQMGDMNTIGVSEYFLESRGIDIPKEWLEDDTSGSRKVKVLRLTNWPEPGKTKYHDIFYQKYFDKHTDER